MRKKKLSAVIMAAVLACSLVAVPAGQSSAAGKVKLNKTKVTLTVGKSTKLKLKNAPKGKKISWKSSKKSVATVSSKGVVRAKKKGTAKITAKVAGKKYTCKVTVKAKKSSYTPYTPYVPTPAPTTQAPAPTTQAPAPTTQAPAPTTQAPVPTTQAPTPTTQAPAPTTQAPASTTQAPTTQKPEQGSTQDEKPTPGQEVKLTNIEGKDEKEVVALEKLIGKLVADGATVSTDLDSGDYDWSDGKLEGIYWYDKNIKGEISFEDFKNLKELDCGRNQITGLNVSANTNLETLSCSFNQLEELDVSNNTLLANLDCEGNKLTSLDVSKNSALTTLECSNNQLKKLNVTGNTKLERLYCDTNDLEELDLSNNVQLNSLSCFDNSLKTLDLTNNDKLDFFMYDEDDVDVIGYQKQPGEPTTEPNSTSTTQKPTEAPTTAQETPTPPPFEKPTGQCIYVSQVKANPGDTNVTVDVMVNENPGILGMTLTIGYDESVMTLKNAENGEAVSDVLTLVPAKTLKSGCNFVWDGLELAEGDIKDGTVLRLTFDIAENAAKGTYPITFTYNEGDIIDNNLAPIQIEIQNGAVQIGEKEGGNSGNSTQEPVNPTNPDDPISPGNPDPITSKPTEQCIYVSQVKANPGDTNVTVDVMVNENPGILGMTLTVGYDESVMTLKNAENGEAVSDVLTLVPAKTLKSGCNFVWDGLELAEGDIKDGTVLRLTFDIAADAAKGTYPVTFTYNEGDIIDNNLAPIQIEIQNGAVQIGEKEGGNSGNSTQEPVNPTKPDDPADPENPEPIAPKPTEQCIYVSQVKANPGDTNVTVDVMVNENPGILGMTLTIGYDESVMTLKNAENGEAVSDVLTLVPAKTLKSGCNFVWDGLELAEGDIKDGTVLRLTFDIAADAVKGTYPITFTYNEGDIIDNNLAPLTLELKDGAVTVE